MKFPPSLLLIKTGAYTGQIELKKGREAEIHITFQPLILILLDLNKLIRRIPFLSFP